MSSSIELKKIAIFGLLQRQQNMIADEYNDDFELSFNKDVLGTATTSIVKAVDSIILMTRFLSHRQKNVIDRSKCLYCTGGMSELPSPNIN